MRERFRQAWINRFLDFFLRDKLGEYLHPPQEHTHFGRCLVERVVPIEDLDRELVILDWPWLERAHKVDMTIYSKKGRYQEGAPVQVIEARGSFDKNIEGFTSTLKTPLTGDYTTVSHTYLARPMEGEKDLLTDNQLKPANSQLLSKLDPIMAGRLEGFPGHT
jgi:hypothetical protein